MKSKSGWRKTVAIMAIAGLIVSLAFGVAYAEKKPITERYRGTTIRVMGIAFPHITQIWRMKGEFEQEYGIKVIVDEYPQDQLQQLSLLDCAQHTGNVDLISVDCMWTASFAYPGYLEPLMKYVNDPDMTLPAFDANDFVPRAWSGTGVIEDVFYNVPMGASSAGHAMRKDYFEAAGLEVPKSRAEWTTDKFYDAAQKLTQPEKGIYGFATNSKRGVETSFTWWSVWAYLFQKPERWCKDELLGPNWEVTVDHPDTVESLRFFVSLKPFCPPGSENFGYDETVTAWQQGRAAIAWTYGSLIGAHFENPEVSKAAGNSVYVPAPLGPYGMGSPHFGSWGIAMNKDSRNKEAAWAFIQWACSRDLAKRWTLEGGHTPRHSVYRDPEVLKAQPYMDWLYDHMLHWANPDTRPMLPEWSEINEELTLFQNKAWIGVISAEEALKGMQRGIEILMREGGYYDPDLKKPVQQWRNMKYYDLNPTGWK